MYVTNDSGNSGVFVLKINEEDINTIFLNTDYDENGMLQYAYDNFANVFSDNILEYAFAYVNIPREEVTKKQREAAKSLLKLHEIEQLKAYFDNKVPETDWDKDF